MIICQCNSYWIFHQSRDYFLLLLTFLVVLDHVCGRGATLWSLGFFLSPKNFFRRISQNRVVDGQCGNCWDPHQSRKFFLVISNVFLVNSGRFWGSGSGDTLSAKILPLSHLMKTKWLVASLTVVRRSPVSADSQCFGWFVAFFIKFIYFCVAEPLCHPETPLEFKTPSFMII